MAHKKDQGDRGESEKQVVKGESKLAGETTCTLFLILLSLMAEPVALIFLVWLISVDLFR
jgi:hypothetical protein